eukprot:RCo038498
MRRSVRRLMHEWRASVVDVQNLTPSVRWLRFAADHLRIAPLSCVTAVIPISQGQAVTGQFAPITTSLQQNYFDLLAQRTGTGSAADAMHSLYPGHAVSFLGPEVVAKYIPGKRKYIGLIAEGTGIAPFVQLIREVVNDPSDSTELRLMYCSSTPEEVFLAGKLDYIATRTSKLQVRYAVAKPDASWKGLNGPLSAAMLEGFLPRPDTPRCLVAVSGPADLQHHACGGDMSRPQSKLGGLLGRMGYNAAQVLQLGWS